MARDDDGEGLEVVVRKLREDVAAQAERREAFLRSTKRWSRLSDDGLLPLVDFDRGAGAVVYELHESSGEQLIQSGSRPASEVVAWMKQAYGALGRLHGQGLLHFNLKPSNLLITRDGQARLADGVCVNIQKKEVLPRPTAEAKYLAPEMIDPQLGAIGPATDVYCLAQVFLELILGDRFDALFADATPGDAGSPIDWSWWHADVGARLPSLRGHADRLPRDLAAVFDRALEKEPDRRYRDCDELLADLVRVGIAEPKEAAPAASNGAVSAARPAPQEPPLDGILTKPQAPIVLRWFGCEADPIGVNADHFSVGDDDRADYPIPAALRGGATPVLLRFSRGAEGWRVSPAEELPVYVNQTRSVGLTPLRSGDVVRLEPGGAGMQFTVVHQGAEPLAKLATRYAPQLIGGGGRGSAVTEGGDAADQSASLDPTTSSPTSEEPGILSWIPSWPTLVVAALVVVLAALAVFAVVTIGGGGGEPRVAPAAEAPIDSATATDPSGLTVEGGEDVVEQDRVEPWDLMTPGNLEPETSAAP